MLRRKVRQIDDSGFPAEALAAYIDAAASIRKLQRHYFPEGVNRFDLDDSEAEALLDGLDFIKSKLAEIPESRDWPKKEWYKHIMRRTQNAVLEYSKYVHSAVVIPRPLRFSLKKYTDALRLINRYVKTSLDVTQSDIYHILFVNGCNPLNTQCQHCDLGYKKCPLTQISRKDKKELFEALKGDRKSLEFYARWYRKTFKEWIRTLEMLRTYSTSYEVPEIPISYDFEGTFELDRLRTTMNDLHPELFEIYCSTLDELDLNDVNTVLVLPTPRGWDVKSAKDKYNLSTEQYRELLILGDKIINQFRVNEGLREFRRDFQEKSSG